MSLTITAAICFVAFLVWFALLVGCATSAICGRLRDISNRLAWMGSLIDDLEVGDAEPAARTPPAERLPADQT